MVREAAARTFVGAFVVGVPPSSQYYYNHQEAGTGRRCNSKDGPRELSVIRWYCGTHLGQYVPRWCGCRRGGVMSIVAKFVTGPIFVAVQCDCRRRARLIFERGPFYCNHHQRCHHRKRAKHFFRYEICCMSCLSHNNFPVKCRHMGRH